VITVKGFYKGPATDLLPFHSHWYLRSSLGKVQENKEWKIDFKI